MVIFGTAEVQPVLSRSAVRMRRCVWLVAMVAGLGWGGGYAAAETKFQPNSPGATAAADPFEVIYRFNKKDGYAPFGAVAVAPNGVIFGTADGPGRATDGVVYSLMPPKPGETAWTYEIIHRFRGATGIGPSRNLVLRGGSIYGAAALEGPMGGGTIFRMDKTANGWKYKILHSFSGPDGSSPEGSLLFASDGSFYGATSAGGANQRGVIYKMGADGVFSVVYQLRKSDGFSVDSNLTFGKDDAIYGLIRYNKPGGVVFRLTTAGSFSRIHLFETGFVGGNLIADSDGKLYGTLADQSANATRGAWVLTPVPGKPWGFSYIYNDAKFDAGSIIQGTSGSFFGLGTSTLFRLSPPKSGTVWNGKVLHHFDYASPDGYNPTGLSEKAGVLYGVTLFGGSGDCRYEEDLGCGTVFKYPLD